MRSAGLHRFFSITNVKHHRVQEWIKTARLLGLLGVCAAGCDPASEQPVTVLSPVDVAYATGFRLLEGDGYKVAEVTRAFPGATDTLRYLLVPRGADVPVGYPGATLVQTPVQRVAALSTTHLAMLDRLELADRVVGVADAEMVYAPAIRARLAAGAAQAVGEGEALDTEALAVLRPDLVMLSSLGGTGQAAQMLQQAGIPIVYNGDWAETTPLGRAEWLRFVAAFFDADSVAAAQVDALARRYARLAEIGRAATPKPAVFVGSDFRGTWYAPGGGSYMATLIADAGGSYLWADTPETGSLSLGTEAVFARAQHADVWLNPGIWRTLADGQAQDTRYALFDAFVAGNVYNYDRRQSPGGGYDFFETGVVEPDVLLADLIRILHPSALPDHTLVYYRRLPLR